MTPAQISSADSLAELLNACRALLRSRPQHLGPRLAALRKIVEAHDEQLNADVRERFLQRQKEKANA